MSMKWIAGWMLGLAFAVPAGAQGDANRSSVEKLNAAWDGAFNRSDAAALAGLYAEDAVVSPGNGKVLTGRDEIRKLFQSFFDAGVREHRIEVVHAHRPQCHGRCIRHPRDHAPDFIQRAASSA